MICYIEDCIRLHYDAEAQLLHYAWCGDLSSGKTLRPALEVIAQLAPQLQIRQCLLDTRFLPPISIEDQFWILHSWLPRVCLPTIECVAVIVGERDYNLMVIESLLRAGRRFIRFDVQLFSDLDAAFDWVVDGHEEATSRLMAEWLNPTVIYKDMEELLARALPL